MFEKHIIIGLGRLVGGHLEGIKPGMEDACFPGSVPEIVGEGVAAPDHVGFGEDHVPARQRGIRHLVKGNRVRGQFFGSAGHLHPP